MKKLLIFVDWFLPGYKAGGQIRSCANLAFALKDDMQVYVVTADRDLGDPYPYDSVIKDGWITLDNNLRVCYLSPVNRGVKSIQSIIRLINPHCIYLNSMFSFNFTLLPIEVCRFRNFDIKIVLAPRGMLHRGALQYKKIKKKVFFHAFKIRGFHKNITFHATNAEEQSDVTKIFGKVKIHYAPDFPSLTPNELKQTEKSVGSLKCIFVARIAPNKNLKFFLSVLKEIKSNIILSIVGPIEDEGYWAECLELIKLMPPNISVKYLGTIPNEKLPVLYRQHHLLVLTSQGESYGHVIFEALSNARPVLISDCTPWKNLEEKKIGWELPLSDIENFRQKVVMAAEWDQQQFDEFCLASWQFALAYIRDSELKEQYLKLFK